MVIALGICALLVGSAFQPLSFAAGVCHAFLYWDTIGDAASNLAEGGTPARASSREPNSPCVHPGLPPPASFSPATVCIYL